MPKAKTKPTQSPMEKTLGSMETPPTGEWLGKHEVEVVQASREGKWTDKQAQTVRKVRPIQHWLGKGWLSQKGAAAMTRWHNMLLIANPDRMRSCCDDTPVGHGYGRPERMIDASREHARIRLELASMIGAHRARELCHFLAHDGTLTQAYREAYEPCRTEECFRLAEATVVLAGLALERIKQRDI